MKFVILKTADDSYRSPFHYSLTGQYGTAAISTTECVTTTLRLQADHEKHRAGATSGKTGADLQRGGTQPRSYGNKLICLGIPLALR
jgi:hypothetical protein